MSKVILDASALLPLLNDEPGADESLAYRAGLLRPLTIEIGFSFGDWGGIDYDCLIA